MRMATPKLNATETTANMTKVVEAPFAAGMSTWIAPFTEKCAYEAWVAGLVADP